MYHIYLPVLLNYATARPLQSTDGHDSMIEWPEALMFGTTEGHTRQQRAHKWLKRDFGGKTAHCLRHAFRDRLRAAEAPLEMVDVLGGWSRVRSVGSGYGHGFGLEHKRRWLESISI